MVDPLEGDDLLFLDPSDIPTVDCLPGVRAEGGGGVEEEEEEELEWLSNKESFPGLETSFEVCAAAGAAGVASAAPLRAPARPRSTRPRRRRRVLSVFQRGALVERRRDKGRERRRCRHCEVEETPQWRAGPEGPKTLCNACGVRYKSGRLLPEYRPAASPTFSPALHSNSHRRVLEMRRGGAARRQAVAKHL